MIHIATQDMILGMSAVHIEGRRTKSSNIYELFKENLCLVRVISYSVFLR